MSNKVSVTLLTGGSDRPYVFGLLNELLAKAATLDLIGSDDLDSAEFNNQTGLTFYNLRGDLNSGARLSVKVSRIIKYYSKLIQYAAKASPRIFHILWNNKFETFDRTLLILYYKFLGKKVVFTAHNVNKGKRDSENTLLNRATLRIQYRLVDHIFVHTARAKQELMKDFGVPEAKTTVIPFGINNFAPNTSLTTTEARQRLGIKDGEKVILFFGRITPYKGVEYLISALRQVSARCGDYRLVIAGRPDGSEEYWRKIQGEAQEEILKGRVILRSEYIPEDQTELYFKAADVLVLPYTYIYQSGVLFLGHTFGLPVLAADVGSLKDEIIEGENGFVFESQNADSLAKAIETYFASELFQNLESRRQRIRDRVTQEHSWDVVGTLTIKVYSDLLQLPRSGEASNRESSQAST